MFAKDVDIHELNKGAIIEHLEKVQELLGITCPDQNVIRQNRKLIATIKSGQIFKVEQRDA